MPMPSCIETVDVQECGQLLHMYVHAGPLSDHYTMECRALYIVSSVLNAVCSIVHTACFCEKLV